MRKWKSAPAEGESGEDCNGDGESLIGATVALTQGYGTIRFVGPTQFASGEWVGVELDGPDGKNDGSVLGVQYFQCSPQHGLFMRRAAIKLASRDGSDSGKAMATADHLLSPNNLLSPTIDVAKQASIPRSPRVHRQHSKPSKKSAKNDQDRSNSALVESFLGDIEEVHNAVKRLAVSLQDVDQDAVKTTPREGITSISNDLVQELCAELRRTREDIRRDVTGLVKELRQEITAIRNEFRNPQKELEQIAVSSKEESQLTVKAGNEFLRKVNPCQSETPTDQEIAAAIKLQARFRGMAQRWENQRRKQAAIFIQRKLRAKIKVGCVLKSTVRVAHARYKEWLVIFDFWRESCDGLVEQSFVGAMHQIHRRLVEAQCRALFNGVTKHTKTAYIDFRTFSSIGEAVSIGDQAASEFADMSAEDFADLANQFVHAKINFKKHRGSFVREHGRS